MELSAFVGFGEWGNERALCMSDIGKVSRHQLIISSRYPFMYFHRYLNRPSTVPPQNIPHCTLSSSQKTYTYIDEHHPLCQNLQDTKTPPLDKKPLLS